MPDAPADEITVALPITILSIGRTENLCVSCPDRGLFRPFIYGYKFGSGKMTETEQHMEQIMSRYWINFTKTGNPNGNSLPFWTTYQEGKPTVMIMKEGLHLGPVQNQKQMDFFEKFFKEKRK